MSSESNQGRVIDVTPAGDAVVGSAVAPGMTNIGHIMYACYAIGYFVGFTWLIGVIIAYVKRDDARGTWMESHFSWLIRTFWWSIVWLVVGIILFITLIGIVIAYPVWIVAWLWGVYRVVKGWIRLNESRAVS